ncbi:hypothetical protein KC725_05735 [Candidatus Peregrinibacteria bacterium]|nr:hypothetical protein [Candidatus Peregrinibacteria bacterium]
MGFDKFALPNEILPEIGERNCYVDLWNYWNPTVSQVKAQLYQDCDFDTSGDWCAEIATNSGAFLDPIGNFAVGLHDASVLQAGVLYSFRYPLELVTLPGQDEMVDNSVAQHAWQCNTVGQYPSAKQCYGDSNIMEDKFRGYYEHSSLFTYDPVEMFPDWGRAQVTMQVFNNKCDLPWVCDKVYKEYTCPHLIGAVNSVAGCVDAQKTTDYWLTNLCLPTGDFEFTPGVAKAPGKENQCMTEATSTNLKAYNSCCIDLDGDGYYGYSQKDLYGRQTGDCNDNNASIHPVESQDGKYVCSTIGSLGGSFAGGGSGGCPQSSECETGDHFLSTCPNGVDQEEMVCENCEWVVISTCPPTGSCQPGTQQSCGFCGTTTCGSNGEWGSCLNQGACSPGQTQQQSCNSVGTQTRTCGSSCTWSGWSSCSAECSPGQTQQQSCTVNGQAGTKERICNSSGQWGSWSGCQSSCQDTYLASSSQPCYSNPQGSGNPTICLKVQQNSGSSWKYQICKSGGAFQNSFDYELKDDNLGPSFGSFTGGANTTCTPWKTINVGYISGYGESNGAGLMGYIKSPSECTQPACQYHTGYVSIRKECQ